jgi:hypothetical protein
MIYYDILCKGFKIGPISQWHIEHWLGSFFPYGYNPSIYEETNNNLRGKNIYFSKSGWHTFEVVHQQSLGKFQQVGFFYFPSNWLCIYIIF